MNIHSLGMTFKAYKTTYKPKVNNSNKTCWSDTEVVLNGTNMNVFWECMRGSNYYFIYSGSWYKIPFYIRNKSGIFVTNLEDIQYHDKWNILKK